MDITTTLIYAAISPPCPFFKLGAANRQSMKARAVCCLGKNERVNGIFPESSQTEFDGHDENGMLQEPYQSSNSRLGTKHDDIWKYFRDAQRNILYINKKRLLAIEELNKAMEENQFLRDKIDQLEVEKEASIGKGLPAKSHKQSILCELLLRIDSMVLTGMIGTGEGSDLRRQIMDNKFSIVDAFPYIQQKRDAELLAEIRQFCDTSKRSRFHIVHICTEMAPVVSVGSLGSYVTGLSHALQRRDTLVEVILPKYTSLQMGEVEGLRRIEAEFYSYFNGQLQGNRVWTGIVCGIGVTFIEPLHYAFFNREMIYGYSDDFERFTYFSRASLDYIVKSGKQPDVLHIHNWETAIVGPLFWDIFVNQGLRGTRILLTCHGFNSQCLEQPDKLSLCGLDPSRLYRPDRLQDNIKTHLVNILKGGIVYSNKVVMMSSVHSKGQIIRSLSHGLEPTLAIHKEKMLIAPYGFDITMWDPSKDKFLPEKYSLDDIKGKAICKIALRRHLGLSGHDSMVVVGCICSEFSDVGLENLKEAASLASRKGAQFIFMGTSTTPSINRALENVQKELMDENVRFVSKYDEALEHLIIAGSDIISCQSFYDPVLQVPLKALKYGAAPVAMGLNVDGFRYTFEHDPESTRTSEYFTSTFANMSLGEAIDQIKQNSSQWNRKMKDAMSMDFSWDAECCDIHHAAYTSIMNM